MTPTNPGNIVPIYRYRAFQRHRQIGQDRTPFGLTAPRAFLLPMQFFAADATAGSTIVWELYSATDDATVITLDESVLAIAELDDASGAYIAWPGSIALNYPTGPLPDCGYWYCKWTIDGEQYFSEVFYLKDICGADAAYLAAVGCTVEGDDIFFTLNGYVSALPGYDYSLQKFVLGWSEISDQESFQVSVPVANEQAQYRIVVTTPCGLIMTREYTATWDSGDPDPCTTLELTLDSSTQNLANVGNNPTWRLAFANLGQDKAEVLYQNGYAQYLYIEPIWDTPEILRDVNATVNGYGNEVARETRTVERRRFEFADVPDYLLGFLAKCGDLAGVALNDVDGGIQFTLTNVQFESRRQGVGLNTGVMSYDAEIEAFAGCQDNFELA